MLSLDDIQEALTDHENDCRRCVQKACKHGHKCLQQIDIEVYNELLLYKEKQGGLGYE